jgi:hypothetical protein
MIEPILLYGSEVWGYENLKILEQIHLKFCKRILKVRNTTILSKTLKHTRNFLYEQ